MSTLTLDREGAVFVLRMRAGENRVNPAFLEDWHAALDEVERSSGEAALVSTGEGKFYSNGLDLDALRGRTRQDVRALLSGLQALLARLLAFPVVTVAALNGHAFAAGLLLALAHDFRVMRTDRGYACLPEIDLATGRPLTPGMHALLAARLPQPTLHEALLTARRYGAGDAVATAIVHEAASEADVLPRAMERASDLVKKDRATLAALKRATFEPALRALAEPVPDWATG